MEPFCFIAFIPCIFLVVWLLIELRKYLIVRKRFKVVEERYKRAQSRDETIEIRPDEDYVQSIPPSQSTPRSARYSERRSRSYQSNRGYYGNNDQHDEAYYNEYYNLYGEFEPPRSRRGRKPQFDDTERYYAQDRVTRSRRKISEDRKYGNDYYSENYYEDSYPSSRRDQSYEQQVRPRRRSRRPESTRRSRGKRRVQPEYTDDVEWD